MIFVTGPFCSGKQDYICRALALEEEEFHAVGIRDVEQLALSEDPEVLAEKLASYQIVIATEIGGGLVPVLAEDRVWREAAGRLACLLAERAETVIRVCCGLPQLLKGEWP